jgi:hypothetical protein
MSQEHLHYLPREMQSVSVGEVEQTSYHRTRDHQGRGRTCRDLHCSIKVFKLHVDREIYIRRVQKTEMNVITNNAAALAHTSTVVLMLHIDIK